MMIIMKKKTLFCDADSGLPAGRRERDVIKREHRSGMHISSYIVSHMVYQAFLCLAQTAVTLYVTQLTGVKYPEAGAVTPVFAVEFMISMFLITYASDMMSLWVSALAKNTTTAMTIMPFVLIFQLVFALLAMVTLEFIDKDRR